MFCGRDYTVGTTEENRREGKPKGVKEGVKLLSTFTEIYIDNCRDI
jgi:hypothetical protein